MTKEKMENLWAILKELRLEIMEMENPEDQQQKINSGKSLLCIQQFLVLLPTNTYILNLKIFQLKAFSLFFFSSLISRDLSSLNSNVTSTSILLLLEICQLSTFSTFNLGFLSHVLSARDASHDILPFTLNILLINLVPFFILLD